MIVKFNLNGVDLEFNARPNEFLLETLREYGIKSVKKGCDASSCGVCVVLMDDKPILSCSILTAKVDGHKIMTVESIQDEAGELAKYFASEGADQCCFCNSAFALMVHALKKENPHPSDKEIKEYMVGTLCRCTGYQSQQKAIKAFIGGKK